MKFYTWPYAPGRKPILPPNVINTFAGYVCTPVAFDEIDYELIDPIIKHIRNILANCNDDDYFWIKNWFIKGTAFPGELLENMPLFIGPKVAVRILCSTGISNLS